MTFGYDLQHAFRTLRKSPGFTCAAVLSLALGIGGNAAIFSIVNGLFLHPAGIERPEGVVAPQVTYRKLNLIGIGMSATDFADVRRSTEIFAAAAMQETRGFNYTGGIRRSAWWGPTSLGSGSTCLAPVPCSAARFAARKISRAPIR